MSTALVIGAGPAGLMAAEVLAAAGVQVTICDAKPSFGRKFLMAGKSGLNLTKDEPFEVLSTQYFEASDTLRPMLKAFDAQEVKDWAQGLGQEIFTGSTGRVFPVAMKASPLMRAWLARLDGLGVVRNTRWRWQGWCGQDTNFETPAGEQRLSADVTILALGGASWSRLGSDGVWADILGTENVECRAFSPANAALSVPWTDHMAAHLGASLKSVCWYAGDMRSRGEATLSAAGLEGGGIYALTPALRAGDPLHVDLVPDKSAKTLEAELRRKPAKLRLAHWLKNTLRLPPAKIALFFEMVAGDPPVRADWVRRVKYLPVAFTGLRPIDEAISTAGGVRFGALTPDLMLTTRAGVFCAGEMLDWEAPTGGYLITGCLATGRWAAHGALRYLADAA